ncbi:hypothetical protein MUS1_12580 [Marinomonas ushuaiensis DSM 15871]|uniref:Uncharacterized protein n=1 Tax=Marinomonas ushuaiensis DSM 15871 TaxID=1122207 RepID=X7E6K2_9GAMM|nr:hypothetical protein MUS1_12580 [Marinomonas ushuaiensis DSM 15871]
MQTPNNKMKLEKYSTQFKSKYELFSKDEIVSIRQKNSGKPLFLNPFSKPIEFTSIQ